MSRPVVVVVGSINIDLVARVARLPRPGETVIGGRFSRHQGGKGANRAVAAARIGADVRFVGAVGDDAMGEEAREAMAAEGIDVTGIRVASGAPTGVALIVVDGAGENQIAVASGANATLDGDWVRSVVHDVGESTVMALDLEIGDEPLMEAVATAAARGIRIVLNPAPARELSPALLDRGPLLIPNANELGRLAGTASFDEAARKLALRTSAPVIVTLGADGALVADVSSVERIPAFRVEAVDATGAGDTFCGVFCAGLAAGETVRAAVTRAIAAAAMSVMAFGARDGMPNREAVERFLAVRER
ncbi:MAG: ribokinase [Candidatus Limnocylindrales bacterium]